MKRFQIIMILSICLNIVLGVCLLRYINHNCYEELYIINLTEMKESLSEYALSFEKTALTDIISDTGTLSKLSFMMDKPFKKDMYSLYNIIKLYPETITTRIEEFTEIINLLIKGDELNAEVKIDELLNKIRLNI